MWDEKCIQEKTEALACGRILSYTEALNEALMLSMAHDSRVFVLGQGVDDPAAMFGVTRGLQARFGKTRVFDTPLSEEAMMGVSVGAAMRGLRPIFFHNRPDFILLAMNQLVNHAAKMHFMDNGQTTVPLVIWAAIGRGWGSGPQHSQSIHGMLLGVPGLKIVMPSTPKDAKGLLISAIEDNNPVLICEHRWLMRYKGEVPEGIYHIPIGKAAYRAVGQDVTLVGCSHVLSLAMEAMQALTSEGISADIIDLRSIKPLDHATILESVKKTRRLIIADTDAVMGGVSAEIAARILEAGSDLLKAPLCRIGYPDVPIPAGYALERAYFPEIEDLKRKMQAVCAAI